MRVANCGTLHALTISAEAAKDRDIEERDALAARLREKDKEKTKALGQGNKKALEEAKKRLELAEADRTKVVPELRKESRQLYLEKRKGTKLDELRADIADEEYLFKDRTITKAERARMAQSEDVGDLIRYIACLPAHIVINEVMINPTWNRGYVANLQRGKA